MKKYILLILAMSFCMFFASAQAKEFGYISVQQSDYVEIEPDTAEINIEIETTDKDLQKATSDNKAISQNVYQTISLLIEKGDYIKTNNYRVNPRYSTVAGKNVFDTYVVGNSVTVKTSNLSILPKIIDSATAQGANRINNLNFSVSNYDKCANELLSNLTKRAYEQANAVAKSSNSKIIGIREINTDCRTTDNQPRLYSMEMAKGAGSGGNIATPISKGKIKIFGNVNASFYVN